MHHVKAFLQDLAASVAILLFVSGVYIFAAGLVEVAP